MKIFKSLTSAFHFLGGVRFAIALIAMAAFLVIIGTILESRQGSHLIAAYWIYEHPFFFFLLALFFINILFAALRRWPFKRRHIPFLITHLGLLMIISGTMIKNRHGLQGQLTVWEGSGNQHLLIPRTYALLIENNREDPLKGMIALNSFRSDIYYPFQFPQLKCKVIGYAPHVKHKLETWIKGSQAHLAGFPPIQVHEWSSLNPFPEANSYQFSLAAYFPAWSILALRTSHIAEALPQAYLQDLTLVLKNKEDPDELITIPLKEVLKNPLSFGSGILQISLDLPLQLSEEKPFLPSLNFSWVSQKHSQRQTFTVALQGQDALLVKPDPSSWFEPFFNVDLIRPQPLLCLMEDEQGNGWFFSCDTYGRVDGQKFGSSQMEKIMAYDRGFGGYGAQIAVPIASFPAGREDKERGEVYELKSQMKQALSRKAFLTPPLQMFEQACQAAQVDFADQFIQFLMDWKGQPHLLYHSSNPLPGSLLEVCKHLNWQALPEDDKLAIHWTYRLLNQLEDSWMQGQHPLKVLEQHHWPWVEQLRPREQPSLDSSPVNLLAAQIASIIHDLPRIDFPPFLTMSEQAGYLSAYFRIYGIDSRTFFPYRGDSKENLDFLENYWKNESDKSAFNLKQTFFFETPLTQQLFPDSIPLKPEDQVPGIVLEVQQGQHKQTLALAYDASGVNLKWPILNGNYTVRFQPKLIELPYRIRLRQARQIHYPQSQQVYSYESDILISEEGKEPIEHTLSMNRVYETWDGYRFYLAGIGNAFDSSLKHIQLAVNLDPAKYFLTYPGAFLVFLGIILLFWVIRQRTNKSF